MNTTDDTDRHPEPKAPEQPLTLDVEVLEERIAPGFLSGLGFHLPSPPSIEICCE